MAGVVVRAAHCCMKELLSLLLYVLWSYAAAVVCCRMQQGKIGRCSGWMRQAAAASQRARFCRTRYALQEHIFQGSILARIACLLAAADQAAVGRPAAAGIMLHVAVANSACPVRTAYLNTSCCCRVIGHWRSGAASPGRRCCAPGSRLQKSCPRCALIL